MMNREWGGNAQIGKAYIVRPVDLGRVGYCWMRGRLKVGDIVLPLRHSGDCFYDYVLAEGGDWLTLGKNPNVPAFRRIVQDTFGAYQIGDLLSVQPTDREWHLLMAGETVNFSADR